MSWRSFTYYEKIDLMNKQNEEENSWACTQVIEQHSSDVTCIQFSQSNILASTSSDKTVCLFKADSEGNFQKSDPTPFLDHKYPVHQCSFCTNMPLLSTCSTDGTIILWNYEKFFKVAVLEHASKCPIRVCKFSPIANLLISGGDDGTVYVWQTDPLTIFKILEGHDNCITSCCFTHDGEYIATTSSSCDIKIWDVQHSHMKCLLFIVDAHDLGVTASSFNPNQNVPDACTYHLSTGGNDGLLKGWKISSINRSCNQICEWEIEAHDSSVMWLEYSRSGKLFASCGGDKIAIVWDSVLRLPIAKLTGHSRFVTCCTFSEDEKIFATCSNDKSIFLWEVSTENSLGPKQSAQHERSLIKVFKELPLPLPSCVMSWTNNHVVQWLNKHGFQCIVNNFTSNNIDGKKLLLLTEKDLTKLTTVPVLTLKRKIAKQAIEAIHKLQYQHNAQQKVPDEMICPITYCIMKDPVIARDGFSYEHHAIQEWFSRGNSTSPMTNKPLESTDTIPNHNLRCLIKKFLLDTKLETNYNF